MDYSKAGAVLLMPAVAIAGDKPMDVADLNPDPRP
jgi:hypothetical protein